jgi:hypothetical protein
LRLLLDEHYSQTLAQELGSEALLTYAKLPVDATGLAPEEWCEDLCELLAWENHGLLMKRETAMFARVHGPLADHAEQVLLALAAESRPRQVAGVVRSG